MQNFELALSKIIDAIGSKYILPQGQYIEDQLNFGQQLQNPYFGQESKKVKFMFGTQKELNIWLVQTKDKYPVIWLVYPLIENSSLTKTVVSYENLRLIFAINNTAEKNVQTRLQTTKFVLDQITENLIMSLRYGKYLKFMNIDITKSIKQSFEPNYSAGDKNQNQSGTVEIWDAIVLDCSINFLPECFKNFKN